MNGSSIANFFQLVGLVLLLIFILIATYFTTRWIGKSTISQSKNKNIKVIETFRISPNKYIQIIAIGEKYIAIGVSKDHIEYLTDLEQEQLVIPDISVHSESDFKEIFSKIYSKYRK